VEIRSLPRLLTAAVLAALLTAGCSATVPGEPTPQQPTVQRPPGAPPLGPPTPQPPQPPQPSAGGCQVTATSTGSISSSGAGGRTATINGQTSFSCGGGPMLTIAEIEDAGVTFVADGAAVTIAPGSTGQAGGYVIGVSRVAGGTAEFQVQPS
jgi:hypothetical protein